MPKIRLVSNFLRNISNFNSFSKTLTKNLGIHAAIDLEIAIGEENKEDFFKSAGMSFEEGLHGLKGDPGGLFRGKSVGSRGNGRKCDCFQ